MKTPSFYHKLLAFAVLASDDIHSSVFWPKLKMHRFCSEHIGQNHPPGVKIWVITWISHKQLPHFTSMSSLKHNNLETLIILLVITILQPCIISKVCIRNEFLQSHFTHLTHWEVRLKESSVLVWVIPESCAMVELEAKRFWGRGWLPWSITRNRHRMPSNHSEVRYLWKDRREEPSSHCGTGLIVLDSPRPASKEGSTGEESHSGQKWPLPHIHAPMPCSVIRWEPMPLALTLRQTPKALPLELVSWLHSSQRDFSWRAAADSYLESRGVSWKIYPSVLVQRLPGTLASTASCSTSLNVIILLWTG